MVCENYHVMLVDFYDGECPIFHSTITIPFARSNIENLPIKIRRSTLTVPTYASPSIRYQTPQLTYTQSYSDYEPANQAGSYKSTTAVLL